MKKNVFKTKSEWLKARETCITGTTIGKYIGVNSPYVSKTPEQMEKDPAVQFGVNCENAIITLFKNLPEIAKQTLILPTTEPTLWLSDWSECVGGSFDALALENNVEGFCEVKSSSAGLYDLKNNIIPDTTWIQIIHYFSLNVNFQFCYLIVCSYPKWGNGGIHINWKKILRSEITEQIKNIRMWQYKILTEKTING